MNNIADFDKDKIKDMEYDPSRGRYVGKDGSELKVTPYSNGTGYKFDYYDSSTYGNAKHNSTHIKSDLNENWTRTDNDREKGTQTTTSGSGCYLTTACMKYYLNNFDDNCYELRVLRWFRDNFVSKEDIEKYYQLVPMIVTAINEEPKNDIIYNYIYDNIVDVCVEAIENADYEFAYNRYKSSILSLEQVFVKQILPQQDKVLKIV